MADARRDPLSSSHNNDNDKTSRPQRARSTPQTRARAKETLTGTRTAAPTHTTDFEGGGTPATCTKAEWTRMRNAATGNRLATLRGTTETPRICCASTPTSAHDVGIHSAKLRASALADCESAAPRSAPSPLPSSIPFAGQDKDGHAPRMPRHHECGRNIPETSRYRDDMAAEAEQSPLPGRSRFTTTWPSDTNPPGSRGRPTTGFQAGGTATGANATTQSGQRTPQREMLQLAQTGHIALHCGDPKNPLYVDAELLCRQLPPTWPSFELQRSSTAAPRRAPSPPPSSTVLERTGQG